MAGGLLVLFECQGISIVMEVSGCQVLKARSADEALWGVLLQGDL